ncbi:YceI family protein [Ferruginibacter sp. HRS2-29]|uniref:YceI family protein n=1 Tax=Ferruginibacter sp. HRS2-29 TaxID=2487334 RepID=UPI0020CF47BC|nr:YceI family protein [Ferruginibacter sp. HRS2-29]MCP9750022.1 polyisoprenoid-binding protein [Ferruginibacter sp. HRS2-29]
MKKIILILSAVFLTATGFSQTTWTNDKMHSKLTFTVNHLGISDIFGLFKDFTVKATTTKPDFSDAVFELTADVASINTEVEMRDNHLKSADFFDVATYPKMTFKSTSIKNVGKDKYQLTGDLTLHGVTKSVTLDLWYRGTAANQSKKEVAGFQLTGKIDRSDFGIGGKFPAAAISNDVWIKADGEFGK